MNRDDQVYFTRRAHQERERAQTASDSSIASVHRTFAAEYERRVERIRAKY